MPQRSHLTRGAWIEIVRCRPLRARRLVWLNKDGRKLLLNKWQERKRETVTHPFLGEKILWGLIPYVQALLLAKFIRKDLDGYPAFLGK